MCVCVCVCVCVSEIYALGMCLYWGEEGSTDGTKGKRPLISRDKLTRGKDMLREARKTSNCWENRVGLKEGACWVESVSTVWFSRQREIMVEEGWQFRGDCGMSEWAPPYLVRSLWCALRGQNGLLPPPHHSIHWFCFLRHYTAFLLACPEEVVRDKEPWEEMNLTCLTIFWKVVNENKAQPTPLNSLITPKQKSGV
jgi:hypothetical protein